MANQAEGPQLSPTKIAVLHIPHSSQQVPAEERLVSGVIAQSGVCLIVDCHSFPSVALPYELDQTSERADICIGTDAFHTPPSVRDAIVRAAKEEGYSVAVDVPFAGALVPLSSYRKDRRVLSMMIEVNRRLYMDENTGLKVAGFAKVQATLGRIIKRAADGLRIHQARAFGEG